MREEIPKLKEIMRDLTTLKDKVKSEVTRDMIQDIIMQIKDVAEILDY